MVNYNEGKIYKIVCNLTNEIYIGSTCMPTLAKRLADHRSKFKRWNEGKGGNTKSFQIIERCDYSIVLIENVNCETKEELFKRERYHIESNTCINKVIPLRTRAEYRDEHKEEIKQYYLDHKEEIKQYYLDHKEQKKEYEKEYYLDNKEKIKHYYLDNKEEILNYHKDYYLKNREYLLEQQKEYQLKNKEHIKEQKKQYDKERYIKKKTLNIIS